MFKISISILLGWIMFSFSSVAISDYYKVSNSGKVLPASATLGTGANDWACTWDSRGGLLWEIKTTSGTRSLDNSYKWSESSNYAGTVNRTGLCGNSSWRMPTKTELESIVYCPTGKSNNWVENFQCNGYARDGADPQINPDAFPNTAKSSSYWTSENYPEITNTAYFVNFYTGGSDFTTQFEPNKIRLVLTASGMDTSTGSAIGKITNTSTTPLTSSSSTVPNTTDPSACVSFLPGAPCVNLGNENKPPVAGFIATSKGLSIDLDGSSSVDSDGSIKSYEWSIETAGQTTLTATGVKPSTINVPKAATYTVTLKVTDNSGKSNNTDSKSQTVIVSDSANAKPIAKISYTLLPQDGLLADTDGVTVSLSAKDSSDTDGQIKSYAWVDSINQNAEGDSAKFIYQEAGTYKITLTVTDDKGATNSAEQAITIGTKNLPPVAKISSTFSPQDAMLPATGGVTVSVNAKGSSDADGQIKSYSWVDSLNQKAEGDTAKFIYQEAGTYKITLTVTDDKGATKSAVQTITIGTKNSPIAGFTMSPNGGSAPLTVALDATSSKDGSGGSNITKYEWKTSDNQIVTPTKTPSLLFTSAGTFTVTLNITDSKGATSSKTLSITVDPKSSAKDFFKISMTGDVLPDSATIADKNFTDNDWVCTYDSRTNLIWQVATIDQAPSSTADGLAQSFNTRNACGVTDWHAPSSNELRSLIMCSSGLPQKWNSLATGCEGKFTSPTVDVNFFPNTASGAYSSTTAAKKLENDRFNKVWFADFSNGSSGFVSKTKANSIRLVGNALMFEYLNNPSASYDDSTHLVVIDAILDTDGTLYHIELEADDNWQFTVKSKYAITEGQANIAKFVRGNIEIQRVYAFDLIFKNVILAYDPVKLIYSLQSVN